MLRLRRISQNWDMGNSLDTPYGPFPSRYKCSRLADLCVEEGGVQTGPFGSQLHQRDYVVDGTPIITVEHLGDNRIVHHNLPLVSGEDKRRLSRYSLKSGDIVFSRVGSVDMRALVRPDEAGWLFSGRCLRVRPNSQLIDPEYLAWFFGLPMFRQHVRQIAVGATMPSLNTALLSGVPIYYPESLQEQRAIAQILTALDSKIELNRRMNESLDNIFRFLFKSWFVDFHPTHLKSTGRAPALPSAIANMFPSEFEESELGKIPKGWRVTSIAGEIPGWSRGVVKTGPFGSNLHAHDYADEGTPLILVKHVENGVISNAGLPLVNKAKAELLPEYLVQANDIVVTRVGRVGCAALVPEHQSGWIYSGQMLRVRLPESSIHPGWLAGWYGRSSFLNEIEAHSVGTTRASLNTKILAQMKMVLPPIELQEEFWKTGVVIFRAQQTRRRESAALSELRDTLLPKLIVGEVLAGTVRGSKTKSMEVRSNGH